MYTFRKKLVARDKWKKKCPYSMSATSITVHNTYNDAPAEKEVTYMISNNNATSFHYAVDDKEVVQGIPETRNAWHCGNRVGNRNSLSVEICYSKSGGELFDKAEDNAAQFIAFLLKERGWGIDKVRTHKSWSGKNCPHRTLERGWGRFLNMIQSYMDSSNPVPQPAPQPTNKLTVDGWWGVDTTRATQKLLVTPVDGIVSGQYQKNMRYLKHTSGGWQFSNSPKGSAMMKALQTLIGVSADGIAGRDTVRALQHYLNRLGYKHLTEDGYLGYNTVRTWQVHLNANV